MKYFIENLNNERLYIHCKISDFVIKKLPDLWIESVEQ